MTKPDVDEERDAGGDERRRRQQLQTLRALGGGDGS